MKSNDWIPRTAAERADRLNVRYGAAVTIG
jgi:hypothetical protein